MDSPNPASGAAGERVQGRSLAAPCRRHRPNPFVDAVGGDGVIVGGVAVDDGDEKDGDRGSLFGDGNREDHAFRASRGSPAYHSLVNVSAAIAGGVAIAAANDGDDDAGGDAEVAKATDPILHRVPHHYSAMDGLGSNDKPPLSRP